MRGLRVVGLGVLALVTAACQQSKSANPLSPDIAGPIPGVTISAPKNLEPFVGQEFAASDTLTFLIENASTSGQRPLALQLQLSSDVNFQSILHQADQVAPGENGRTAYRLSQQIGSPGTYYWRSRAADGANTGPYSAPTSFKISEPVVIGTPTPIEPLGQINTVSPVFKVQNGTISGPAGAVIYRVEVASAPDAGAIAAVMSSGAGSGGTTSFSGGNGPYATVLYWRTYATNGTVQSAASPWVAFRTPNAPTVVIPPTTPPIVQPPPGGGTVGGPRSISESEALSIIRGVHDGTGVDLGSRSSRDGRNRFFAGAVAVLHYGHARFNPKGPDSNWCIKDGGNGRPQSDDVMVRCSSRDAWDLIGGAGANGYSFHLDYIGRLPGDQNVYAPSRSSLP